MREFTLVELIVVLVILAILAAILVPALLGWIDKAREKQYVLTARNVLLASQTKASEFYAKDTTPTAIKDRLEGSTANSAAADKVVADIAKIADIDVTGDHPLVISNIEVVNSTPGTTMEESHDLYEINGMTIVFPANGEKITATLASTDGTWTIEKEAYN